MRGKLIALSAALALAAGVAAAQDKTFELKLAHWVPPSHPLQKALEDWGASVEKASGGTIKYKVYPVAAARQGVRPLRHGARRHRRPHLRQSGLSARPLPDHRRRRTAVPDLERQGRLAGARRLVPQVCREGDEGRQVLPRLPARSRHVPLQDQEDHGAGRHQGHEDPPGARHHGDLRHAARRHQRAVRARRKCATSSRRASPRR